ncbi:MAG: hypothetical protein IIA27_15275, partial [Gemmatimonadetes bacterium]|nr:hypothetical protein [Gemmatimonadota bacterium]
MLLTCPNGTVELRTGQLRPHAREDLLTKLAGAEFDPQAEAPLFSRMLARIFRTIIDDHPDWLEWLQRALGY